MPEPQADINLPPGKPGIRKDWPPRAWRAFNGWRKRHWKARVLILLLLAVPALLPSVPHAGHIAELVRIACRAIRLSVMPANVTMRARYHRAEAVDTLQRVLVDHLDADASGALEGAESEAAIAAGVRPEQLSARVIEADLQALTQAAKRAGLLSRSVTATGIRLAALDAARAESERFFAPRWTAIEEMIDTAYDLPDYTRWETWKRGLSRFPSFIIWPLYALAPCWTVCAWLGLCTLFTVTIVHRLPGCPRWLALLAAAVLMLAVLGATLPVLSHREAWMWRQMARPAYSLLLKVLALGCFTAATADAAQRAARRLKPDWPVTALGLLAAGGILLCWGLAVRHPNPLLGLGAEGRGWGEYFLHAPVDAWIQCMALLLGCVALLLGVCFFARRLYERRRAHGRPEET